MWIFGWEFLLSHSGIYAFNASPFKKTKHTPSDSSCDLNVFNTSPHRVTCPAVVCSLEDSSKSVWIPKASIRFCGIPLVYLQVDLKLSHSSAQVLLSILTILWRGTQCLNYFCIIDRLLGTPDLLNCWEVSKHRWHIKLAVLLDCWPRSYCLQPVWDSCFWIISWLNQLHTSCSAVFGDMYLSSACLSPCWLSWSLPPVQPHLSLVVSPG